MNSTNNFVNSAIYTLLTSLIIIFAGLLTGSITAQILGVEGRGEFAAIQLYGGLIATLVAMGIPASITYFTGLNPENAGSYYITGILVSFIFLIPAMILGYLAMPYLLSAQTTEIISAAQLYLLFVPLSIFTGFSLASIQGQMKMFLWNILRIIAVISWLIPLIYLIFFSSISPIELSKLYLIIVFFYSMIFIFAVLRTNQKEKKIRMVFIRPIMKYAIPTHLATFTQQSNLKLDQILIAALLSPDLLGLYIVAITWSAAYSPLVNAVSYLIVPHLTSVKKTDKKTDSFLKISRVSFVINLFLGLLVIIITPAAISIIFGPDFMPSVTICYILIVASLISNLKLIFAEGLRGLGHPALVMKGELIGLVACLGLFPVFLNFYSLEGLAFASLIGYIITFSFYLSCIINKLKVSASALLKPKKQDFVYIVDQLKNIFNRFGKLSERR